MSCPDGHDDLGDGIDNRLECGTDDDGDGELEGVALRNELLESLDHGVPFVAARADVCRGAPSGTGKSEAPYHPCKAPQRHYGLSAMPSVLFVAAPTTRIALPAGIASVISVTVLFPVHWLFSPASWIAITLAPAQRTVLCAPIDVADIP